MNRWELVDRVSVPESESAMSLLRRGHELSIMVDGRQLMSSLVHGSEDALADLVCKRLVDRPEARVLIGGLGMGFTLAAALKGLGPEGRAVVAELVPGVVTWNRGPIGPVAGHPLADPRASVFDGDVRDQIGGFTDHWDAILLDVDNGPTGLTRPTNDWLYAWKGLEAAHRALRPNGILAVWSAAPDPGFTRRMERAGFDVEPIEVRSRGAKGGSRHVVWVGVRRSS